MFIIMNKNKVFEGLFFNSEQEARNFIKFKYPKRKFKENVENTFICKRWGTTFKVQELKPYK